MTAYLVQKNNLYKSAETACLGGKNIHSLIDIFPNSIQRYNNAM